MALDHTLARDSLSSLHLHWVHNLLSGIQKQGLVQIDPKDLPKEGVAANLF